MRIKSAVLARVHLPLTFSHCGCDTAENIASFQLTLLK